MLTTPRKGGAVHGSFCDTSAGRHPVESITHDTSKATPVSVSLHRQQYSTGTESFQQTSEEDSPQHFIGSGVTQRPQRRIDAHGRQWSAVRNDPDDVIQARILKNPLGLPGCGISGSRNSPDDITDSTDPSPRLLYTNPTASSSHQQLTREMITARWSRSSKLEAAEARGWPLHVKKTDRLDWKKLTKSVHSSLLEKWELHSKYFTVLSAMMGESFVIDETEADLEPGDIEELLRCMYVEPVDGKYVRGTVRVFWVAEMLKKRRRLVTHPRQQNDLPFQKEPDIFPKDSEIFDIENKEVAACIDMRAFFNQFELPSMLRNFFCFKAAGVWYRLCTIPTGGRESPIIAQIIMRSLALRLEDSCQVKATAFIDNLRLMGTPAQVEKALRLIFYICKQELGMQINEAFSMELITSRYTFLGIEFDHGKQEVRIAEGALSRLCLSPPLTSASTVRDCLVLFGRLIAASRILDLQVPYYCVKFLRKRVGWPLDAQANLWPSTMAHWETWHRQACENTPRCLKKPLGAYTIYTDASSSGWGAVLLGRGAPRIVGAQWPLHVPKKLHINVLETLAVALALKAFDLRDCKINIRLDSTVALSQFSRPLSMPRCFWLAGAKKLVVGIMLTHNISLARSSWIKSEYNPADAPSREWTGRESTNVLQALAAHGI